MKITATIGLGLVLLGTTNVQAQSKKYVLLEHFTQASCGPCASQNPVFENGVHADNPGTIHHIAYHTSWPGVDPMYDHNPSEIGTRTSFYGVSGVPDMIMLGNQWEGGPAGLTQGHIDGAAAPGSPIKIRVNDVDNGSTHDVDVTVTTTGTAPTGSYVLRVAVVEGMVSYATPPGSNGETDFPNVFRLFIANSTNGDPITLPGTGTSTTMNYTYTEDGDWDQNEIYIMAWVQETSTKEVINSGSSKDAKWELNNYSSIFGQGTSGNTSTFNSGVTNDGTAPELFRITLTDDAPADWSADFTIGGSTYTSTADVTVGAATLENMSLDVDPGATNAIATYTFELESLDDPSKPHQTVSYTVMSGITDLIITNDGEADLSEQVFLDGLAAAGNTAYDMMSASLFITASSTAQIAGVNNLYYNVGWTFPCFESEMVAELTAFMDAGGDVFMAGQDIAWSTFDSGSPYVSASTSQFISTYFGVDYVGDGSTANSSMNPEVADPYYGATNTMTIVDIHGGNMYPDELAEINSGTATYFYNGGTKIGAIRQHTTHKASYFGIDMAMIQNAADAEEIIHISHDWFYGLLSDDEYDAAMAKLTAYPNPSNSLTTIEFDVLNSNAVLNITDMTGKLIFTDQLMEGTSQYNLDVTGFSAGTYFYSIVDKNGVKTTKKLQVSK